MLLFRRLGVATTLLLLLLTAVLVVDGKNTKNNNTNQKKEKKKNTKRRRRVVDPNTIQITRSLRNLCDSKHPISTKADEKRLQWLAAASGENSLLLTGSPQKQAACWMLYQDTKQSKKKRKSIQSYYQRYALAVLHYATTKSNHTAWDWPMAADDPTAIYTHGNWLSTAHHECQWYGVVCNTRGSVVELNLGFLKLDGIIPRELSLLTYLNDLDFHGNDFQGVVPHKILDQLEHMEYLRLHMNGFFGAIHSEIVGMPKLKELILFGNYFAGKIPKALSQLTHLTTIDLYANQLSGTIPSELGMLRQLKFFDAHDNNLTGRVPKELCALKLDTLIVDCLGPHPEVKCDCCTVCCRGLPDFKCVDQKTNQEITRFS